jgi:hypothetical protein
MEDIARKSATENNVTSFTSLDSFLNFNLDLEQLVSGFLRLQRTRNVRLAAVSLEPRSREVRWGNLYGGRELIPTPITSNK